MFKKLFLFFCLYLPLFSSQRIEVDQHLSPYSGASNLFLAENLFIDIEDYFFPEYTKRNSTAKVFGRACELLFIWDTINGLGHVTQHEVFGHGYRLRELDLKVLGYTIQPYSGATYFERYPDKIGKHLAIDVAGLEAEAILARRLKMQWLKDGCIDGRQSTLYTKTAQSLFFYTVITKLGKIKGEISEGNDVNSYRTSLNTFYPNHHVSMRELTTLSVANWLDPMTFYAYISWFYYIAYGKPWSIPMISIKEDVKYLPNIRIAYTPCGTEGYLENFFLINGKPLYCYLRAGRRSVGIGVEYDSLLSSNKGNIGVKLDTWGQNNFLTSSKISSSSIKNWGIAASFSGTRYFSNSMGIFIELGGKSKGYLPGYSLKSDVVARVGIAIKN